MTEKKKPAAKAAPKKAAPKKAEPKEAPKAVRKPYGSKDVEADINKLLENVISLAEKNRKEGKPFKHLLIVKNRVKVLKVQYDRFVRAGFHKE